MLTVEAFRVEVGREEAGGTDLSGLTLVGSGWHPALFRSEAEALVGPVGFVHPRVVITNSIDEEALNRLSRSALVDEVLCKAEHSEVIEPTRIIQRITDWASKHLPNGSFAVRVRVIGSGLAGFSRSAIAQGVGGELSSDSHPVDLENPENEIVVILAGPEDPPNHPDPLYLSPPMIIWGLKQENWQRSGWGGRSPMDRPFFQPVSLEPRLARLMISLGHRSDTEPTTVIDPFCGTGGIAIEAMLAGLNVLASDLDPKMVKGTKENLQWASEDLCSGYSATWDVQESGVGLTPDVWGKVGGAIFAFDPPYGRNAWKSDDGYQLFLKACSAARTIDHSGSLCTLLPTDPAILKDNSAEPLDYLVMGKPWSKVVDEMLDRGWKVALTAPVKVHRSLARLLVVAHPSH
ncbi:MAG: THUMP domain-containing protein [Candidatus Thermoplasmatota archaeon]|nr:THUMP domain-containing protein [Candidatus Thermoplasmatota archaeon]